ncbi:MAG: ATP-binding protein, partial [Duganella sp.]
LADMDDMLRRVLGPRAVVIADIAPRLWNTDVDVSQLNNVILNLAINARDAMGGDGTLTIRARNLQAGSEQLAKIGDGQGDYVLIEIADTGSGMSQEVIQRAFEPFFTTKPTGQGTGLGLSMAYGFVKQSGGEIALQSTLGTGTCVQIYLRRSEEQAEPEQHVALQALTGGVETLLVVEDDEAVRAATVDMLATLGYHVLSSANAEQATRLVNGGVHIDLLFTDVMMPGRVSSLELSELVRAKLPHAHILFTSGYAEGVLSHDGRLPPGVNLLQKPYTVETLSSRIRHLLRKGSPTTAA